MDEICAQTIAVCVCLQWLCICRVYHKTPCTCTDWCVRVIHYPPLSKGTFHTSAQGNHYHTDDDDEEEENDDEEEEACTRSIVAS